MRIAFPCLAALALASATPAFAQAAESVGAFERGYGMDNDSWDQPINPSTRDENGNRLVVDGRIMNQSTLFGGLGDGGAGDSLSGTAVGNQLVVVTQGSWNTVIVDSTQINNGDQSVVLNGDNQ